MDRQQAQLLASIIANPADDMVRLAYADWLEENGEKADIIYAMFIRQQLRIPTELLKVLSGASLITPVYGIERNQIVLTISPTTSERPGGFQDRLFVRRGFPYHIRTVMEGWIQDGPRYCQLYPIEFLEITDVNPQYTTQDFWQQMCSRKSGVRKKDLSKKFWQVLNSGRFEMDQSRTTDEWRFTAPWRGSYVFIQACLAWAKRRAIVLQG